MWFGLIVGLFTCPTRALFRHVAVVFIPVPNLAFQLAAVNSSPNTACSQMVEAIKNKKGDVFV
jgi:hypothetical protein